MNAKTTAAFDAFDAACQAEIDKMDSKLTLNAEARATVNSMATLLMHINGHTNQDHALQRNAYGSVSEAIKQFLAVETGIVLQVFQEYDFNWGGNNSYAEDAQQLINGMTA